MNRIGKRREIQKKSMKRSPATPNETAAGHAYLALVLPRTAQNQFGDDSGIDQSRERSFSVRGERVGGDRSLGEKANSIQERFWRVVQGFEEGTGTGRSSGELGGGERTAVHDAGASRSGG